MPTSAQTKAAWIFGSVFVAFLLGVFIFGPATLPDFKITILAYISALLAGLFAVFFTGSLILNAELPVVGKWAVQGGAGFALFLIVLFWWRSPAAPIPKDLKTIEAASTPAGSATKKTEKPSPAPAATPIIQIRVEVTLFGLRSATVSPRGTFKRSTGQFSFGCEESKDGRVEWIIPAGATDVQPSASWQNIDNVKGHTQGVSVQGSAVVATGTITGRDKQVFNCPGGGHGELVLEGSYQPGAEASTPTVVRTSRGEVRPGESVSIPVQFEPGGITPSYCDVRIVSSTGETQTSKVNLTVDAQGRLVVQGTLANGPTPISAVISDNVLKISVGTH